jgi:hypothetical protein
VTVTWPPNTEKDVAGYKLYVGNAPGFYGLPITVGNVTRISSAISRLETAIISP